MTRTTSKLVRKLSIALPIVAAALYFIPFATVFYLACGTIDVMRNDIKDVGLFTGYFLGNGIFTWLLSPFNLLVDLISNKNPGVWKLDDFPPGYRREIEAILAVFTLKQKEIIADIDANFASGRRGMYVYQWYGKHRIDNVPEFVRPFRYVRTIAVSVFSGRESTSLHFGPLRLTVRVLYNLAPAATDRTFVECGKVKNIWYENPLFIFDDTLRHRSVNEYDGRRYCVFMDIIRPSPFPNVLAVLVKVISFGVERINSVFYKNWRMIGRRNPEATEA